MSTSNCAPIPNGPNDVKGKTPTDVLNALGASEQCRQKSLDKLKNITGGISGNMGGGGIMGFLMGGNEVSASGQFEDYVTELDSIGCGDLSVAFRGMATSLNSMHCFMQENSSVVNVSGGASAKIIVKSPVVDIDTVNSVSNSIDKVSESLAGETNPTALQVKKNMIKTLTDAMTPCKLTIGGNITATATTKLRVMQELSAESMADLTERALDIASVSAQYQASKVVDTISSGQSQISKQQKDIVDASVEKHKQDLQDRIQKSMDKAAIKPTANANVEIEMCGALEGGVTASAQVDAAFTKVTNLATEVASDVVAEFTRDVDTKKFAAEQQPSTEDLEYAGVDVYDAYGVDGLDSGMGGYADSGVVENGGADTAEVGLGTMTLENWLLIGLAVIVVVVLVLKRRRKRSLGAFHNHRPSPYPQRPPSYAQRPASYAQRPPSAQPPYPQPSLTSRPSFFQRLQQRRPSFVSPPVYAPPQPPVYAPPPVYAAPQPPVYAAPQPPVYAAPQPPVYAPPPVYSPPAAPTYIQL